MGYVALYMHDLPAADTQFTKALAMKGNEHDPFLHCLLAMTDEQLGKHDDAAAHYKEAYDLAKGHNPPSAFVRRYVRAKLERASSGS